MFTLTAPAGDMNCDGVVNLFDVDAFVVAITSSANTPPFDAYDALYPNCDPNLADMDGDGAVNLFDIDMFVDAATN